MGTFGLFMFCFFLFSKFLPVVNMFEVKTLVHHPKKPEGLGDAPKETATV